MTAVESPEQVQDELRRVAASDRLLVALDFDGTLSLLQDEPMQARMLPESRRAVEALLATPDTVVALVSGRSLHDLQEISEHTEDSEILLAGSHGVEYWYPGEGAVDPVDDDSEHALRDHLRESAIAELGDLEGIWVEPKTFGFGIHTRMASDEDAERAWQYADALVSQNAPHWRRRTGHNIVEYSFRHEGKDSAIASLRERVGATAVVFAGDDITDEDALAKLGPSDLGIRVGQGRTSARVRVMDTKELAAALSALAEMRASGRE
ncbi:trehalose-phosphatase [Microbacterium rhizomatis]|uniref:Trehalose 6-phosphate phosphatase n=1 Tax=Microbacterium rhizomatis TaxID=1631477 RepID=A0A5J5J3L5_9MICO|nr:trehalose-phosphatase [Microbacterium rhizomatis]KAA9110646.1 trehalose-phosphatase [Microbacterium rhizomatis]